MEGRNPENTVIYTLVAGTLSTIVAIGMAYNFVFPEFLRAFDSSDWPSSKATITRSKVVKKTQSNRKGVRRVYQNQLRYFYRVKDTEYQGQNLNLVSGKTWSNAAKATSLAAKYKAGSDHPVFFNPQDPAESTLIPGPQTRHYLAFIGNLIFLFGSVAVTIAGAGFSIRRGLRKRYFQLNPHAMEKDSPPPILEGTHFFKSRYSSPLETPWKYEWFIYEERSELKEGPYSFDTVVTYFEKGRIRPNQSCGPAKGNGETYKVSDIVHKLAS